MSQLLYGLRQQLSAATQERADQQRQQVSQQRQQMRHIRQSGAVPPPYPRSAAASAGVQLLFNPK